MPIFERIVDQRGASIFTREITNHERIILDPSQIQGSELDRQIFGVESVPRSTAIIAPPDTVVTAEFGPTERTIEEFPVYTYQKGEINMAQVSGVVNEDGLKKEISWLSEGEVVLIKKARNNSNCLSFFFNAGG